MLMSGLLFVLYFAKLLVGTAFRLNVLYRMSCGSSPMIPFFVLFICEVFLLGLGY